MQPCFMHIIHDYSSGEGYYTNEALFTLVNLQSGVGGFYASLMVLKMMLFFGYICI